MYKDIDVFNKKEQIDKQKKTDYEKMKDKELIGKIMDKEKALDEIDKREKEKKKLEFYQNKMYLEYIMNQKKEAVRRLGNIIRKLGWISWHKSKLISSFTRTRSNG